MSIHHFRHSFSFFSSSFFLRSGTKARALEEFNEDRERRAQKDSAARRARASASASNPNDLDSNKTPSLNLHQDTSNKRVKAEPEPEINQIQGSGTLPSGGSGRRLGGDLEQSHTQVTLTGTGDEVEMNTSDDEGGGDHEEEEEDDEEDSQDEDSKPKEKVWGKGQRLGGD